MYSYVDEAPFSVPTGAKAHYVVTIANAALTLGNTTNILTTAVLGVPSATDVNGTRYPKAVCLAALDSTADVWVTVDGQTPVIGTTQPVGVKLPATYPTLRIPYPGAIKNDTIKLISGSAGGTPVLIYFDW
jgi:hypothetical protein